MKHVHAVVIAWTVLLSVDVNLCDNAIEVDATNVIQDSGDDSNFKYKPAGSQE